MFVSTSQRNDDGLRASYISLLIAKSGKPHTIGEKLILPAVEEVLKIVLHKPASDIIKRIPLSNNTVERRIDEMSSDIESFLCNYLQTTHFTIQLDETTLPDNAALLLAYVRFIMIQGIYEELLFARTLITDTKGESIFHVLKDYFIEKAILLSNIISVATDGAPAMVGRYRGFISYLNQNVSGVLPIHCVIHRHHLVAKNLSVRLHESLHLVIDAVNRYLRSCVKKMTNTFINYSFTLKYAGCRKAYTILEFLDTKDKILKENLTKRKTDIACLTDLFTKFNMVNLQLQGDSLNLIKTKSILSAFLARFPNLSQTSCQEDDVSTYVQHLNALYSDFESRFEDILTTVIPPWIINPYGDIEETNVIIQEELTELSANEELKVQFKNGCRQFWLQNNVPVTYPVLWNIARKFLISFPSSYLVERGFSATSCQEDDVSTYVQHLNALYSDFESRFEDILTTVIPPWIINPYGDIEKTNVIIQEELTELSTNEELEVQFKNGYQQFWLQNNIPVTYPVLWNIARKLLISFPSSYLVERGFSAVTNLLTKKRNRLDIISQGDLRLTLTKLTPNLDNLLLKH
ncbi:unnamed protein product [Acanthoscelides obtectus]|uniref:HAT C-terminal dimerisation domain-containing protein n=1 Tax=Acanthoscelides obtectus TaxID=200917 RepID=A0A9P0L0Y2_ACAOB|nr:unnamed protein product [Acanthoscelides obtectus]CAK1668721.1 Protein ZBED8 [Acanthoscelides obtectus]